MFLTEDEKEKLKKLKQRERILYCLEKFGKITVNDCFYALGIAAAPRRIKDLRDMENIPIESIPKKGKDRWGQDTNYVEYTLDTDKYTQNRLYLGGSYAG